MVVREDPLLIVDGAHNVPGIQALIRSLKGFHGTIYFSALKEKEVDRMIRILFEFDSTLFLFILTVTAYVISKEWHSGSDCRVSLLRK